MLKFTLIILAVVVIGFLIVVAMQPLSLRNLSLRKRSFVTLFLILPGASFSGGCENFIYSYDCRGTLLGTDGTPARTIQVHVDEKGPPLSSIWWEDSTDSMAVTDSSGHFHAELLGDVYKEWIFKPSPGPPVLPAVYLWFKTNGGWSAIHVPIADQSKVQRLPCAHAVREVQLSPASIPAVASTDAKHQ